MPDLIDLSKVYEATLGTVVLPVGRPAVIVDSGKEGLAIGTPAGNKILPRTSDLGNFAQIPETNIIQAIVNDRTVYNDTGTVNAYAITVNTPPTAYTAYQMYRFKAANTNTGASTITVGALGAKSLVKGANLPLVAGDILAGQIVTIIYDGTNVQIVPDYNARVGNIEKIVHGSVADLTTLKAINTTGLTDNITIIVKTLGFYRFDSSSVLTADDSSVVQPTTGSGRWINDLLIYNKVATQQFNARPTMTLADITLYVNASIGNDITGDGTSLKPYATSTKAVSTLPQINYHTININVADGTYNEDVSVKVSGVGIINITGNITTPTNVNVNSFTVSDGCTVNIKGFNATSTIKHSFSFIRCIGSITNCVATTDGKTNSVSGLYGASAKVASASCTFSNKNAGIYCGTNSKISSLTNSGVNNNIGVYAESNGSIGILGTYPLGVASTQIYAGGRIHMSATHQAIVSSRDLSIGGVQTFTGLNGVPRRVILRVGGGGLLPIFSDGSYETDGAGQTSIGMFKKSDGSMVGNSHNSAIAVLFSNESNYLLGTIQNISGSQFEVNWTKTGAPVGTANLVFIIEY